VTVPDTEERSGKMRRKGDAGFQDEAISDDLHERSFRSVAKTRKIQMGGGEDRLVDLSLSI
jgi:hypothetical protein